MSVMTHLLPFSLRYILTVLVLAAAVLWWGADDLQAANDGSAGWKRMVTRRTVVHYRTLADLVRFNDKVAYYPGDLAIESLSVGKDTAGIQGILEKKLDKLFERAQEILGMRKRIVRVNIRIYPDAAALNEAYRSLFGEACPLRAWYLFETKSVYINANDTHEGMVAHEMGHHIIDHFFKVRPPAASAEILARYVDANLMAQ